VATERAKQADAEAKIKVLEDQIASLKNHKTIKRMIFETSA
jgi:hypothetical protein